MLTKKIQKLNLLDYSIYHECDPNMQLYFDISDIQNRTLGFGKHSFEISVSSPFMSVTKKSHLYGLSLKEKSNVLFEVVDSKNNTVFSSLTTLKHVNGSSFGYIQITPDLLDNYEYIANGPAKLVIVGELAGKNLPSKWKNSYNVRKVIPFNIKKQHPNESSILFQNKPNVTSSISYDNLALRPDDDNYRAFDDTVVLKYRHLHYFDNLHTYGGKIEYIEIYKKIHSEAPSEQSWEIIEKVPISGSQELLTKTQFPLSDAYGNQTYNWIGNFRQRSDVSTYYYNGLNAKISVDTNMLTGEQSTYQFDAFAKALRIEGDNSVHSPIIRKTVTDEEFNLQLLYSGSGAYAVLASKNKSALENPVNGSFTYNDEIGTNPSNKDWDVIVHKKFKDFNPYTRLYPNVYGKTDTTATGYFDKVKFTIPKDTYFTIRLMGGRIYTSSFADVSVKHTQLSGVNPPQWLHGNTAPFQTGHIDNIEYYYKFLTSNNEVAKDYTQFPVHDIDTKTTLENYTPLGEVISRKAPLYALKVKNKSLSMVHSGILSSAHSSGSYQSGFLPASPGNIAGITGVGVSADDNTSPVGIGSVGVQALGMVTKNLESSETRVQTAGGSYTWNTGSLWSAYFGGSGGGGDAYFSQNVAIGGDFNWPFEHPTHALHVKGGMRIEGDLTAEQFIVSSSVTHITELKKSGSTEFGDSTDDTHQFFGHITASGNISSSGNVYADSYHSDTVNGGLRTPHLRLGKSHNGSLTPTAISHYANTNSMIQFHAASDKINITSSVFLVESNITASGNISASGDLYAENIHLDDYSYIYLNSPTTTDDFMQYDSINDQIFVKTDFIHLGSVYGVGIGSSNAVNKGMVGLTVDGKISSSMAIETLSHITASGNISANGAGPHNFGGNIYVDTDKYIGEQSEGGRIRFRGSSVIVTEGSFNTNNNTTLGTALGDEITIKGHITASGNISSSGQLIAASADFNEGNITNVGEISVDKVIADTTTEVVLSLSTAGMAFGVDAGDVYQFNEGEIDADWKYIDAANDVLIHGDAGLSRVGIGTTTPSSKLTVHGDISASGDIMGVGTLYMSGEKGDPSSSIDGDGAKFWSTAVGAPFFNLENSHASLGMPGFNIGYAGDNMGEAPISIRGTVKNSLGGALEPFYPEQNTLSIFSGSITNNLPKGFNVRLGDNDYDDGVRVGIRKLRPTKELEVNGDISASGQYFGNQILITHHLADIAESTERNIPAPSYFIDNTSNNFLYRWIAPYDGELEKILVHPSGTPGSTVMTLYAGTGATDKKDSVTVDMSSADTTYTFPCTSGSTITAGDLIKVGYNASADSDQVSFTCVWKYKII